MTTRKIYEKDLDDGVHAELYEKEGGSPEIFIDGAWGAFLGKDGIFKINLFTRSITGEEGLERREIAARLAMSGVTLAVLAKFLNERVQNMIQQGIIVEPTEKPTREKSTPRKSRSKKSTPPKRRRSKTKSK